MSSQGARNRAPAGTRSGGQWTSVPRPEPRLRLVVFNPPGLDDEDAERFRRIDARLVENVTLTALEKMTYSRLATTIDEHLDPEDLSARMQVPDCPSCGQPWGRPLRRTCRVCTTTYGDPLPLQMRMTMRERMRDLDDAVAVDHDPGNIAAAAPARQRRTRRRAQ